MNRNTTQPACENCGHAQPGDVDPNNIGAPRPLLCRRYPPQSHPVNVGGQLAFAAAHPQVPPQGLCGEWESTD